MIEEAKKEAQIEWAKKRLADTISHLHELVRAAVRFSIVGNGTALGVAFAAMGAVTTNGDPPPTPINMWAASAILAFGVGLICGVFLLLLSIKQAEHERQSRRGQLNSLVDVEVDVEPDFVIAEMKRHHRRMYNKNIVSQMATLSVNAILLFVAGMTISVVGTMIFLLGD